MNVPNQIGNTTKPHLVWASDEHFSSSAYLDTGLRHSHRNNSSTPDHTRYSEGTERCHRRGYSSPRACGRCITGTIWGWQGPSHWHMLDTGEMVVVVAAPEQWNAAHVLFHSSAKEQFITWLFLWSLLSLTLSVKSLLLQPSVDNWTSKNLRKEIWFMLVAVGW